MMMWQQFGQALRKKAADDGVSLTSIERDTGLSHARVHDASTGRGVGTENYLTLCKWMNVHPGKFWSGDARDKVLPMKGEGA